MERKRVTLLPAVLPGAPRALPARGAELIRGLKNMLPGSLRCSS